MFRFSRRWWQDRSLWPKTLSVSHSIHFNYSFSPINFCRSSVRTLSLIWPGSPAIHVKPIIAPRSQHHLPVTLPFAPRVVHSQKNFSVPNVFMARELNCSVSDGNTIIEWIIYAFIKPSSLLSQLNSTRLCCAVLFIIYTEHFTKCIELFILFIFIILI